MTKLCWSSHNLLSLVNRLQHLPPHKRKLVQQLVQPIIYLLLEIVTVLKLYEIKSLTSKATIFWEAISCILILMINGILVLYCLKHQRSRTRSRTSSLRKRIVRQAHKIQMTNLVNKINSYVSEKCQ